MTSGEEEIDFSYQLTDRCVSVNSFSDENLEEIDFYGNNASIVGWVRLRLEFD